jgi:hypothetical protein
LLLLLLLLLSIIYTINLPVVRPRSCRVIYYFDTLHLGKDINLLVVSTKFSNPTIIKFQVNPAIRKHQEISTLQSRKSENPTIRKFSRKEKDQPIIMKNLQVNPAIKKHQVFKPYN